MADSLQFILCIKPHFDPVLRIAGFFLELLIAPTLAYFGFLLIPAFLHIQNQLVYSFPGFRSQRFVVFEFVFQLLTFPRKAKPGKFQVFFKARLSEFKNGF